MLERGLKRRPPSCGWGAEFEVCLWPHSQWAVSLWPVRCAGWSSNVELWLPGKWLMVAFGMEKGFVLYLHEEASKSRLFTEQKLGCNTT